MLCTPLDNYLKTAKGFPFFYSVGDDEYCSVLSELEQAGLKQIRVSDFCPKDDKYPDIDNLIDFFRTGDVDFRNNKFVLTGLGEYLALRGADEINSILTRLKTTTLGNARVVLLLRGISSFINYLSNIDNRIKEKGQLYSSSNSFSNISATNVIEDVGLVSKKGVKWLIYDFENGLCSNILFSSTLSYENSIIPILTISNSYSAIKYSNKHFPLEEKYGTKEQWDILLSELNKHGNSIDTVFEYYNVDDNFEDDFLEKSSGFEFKNWLYFISAKINIGKIKNEYLCYVVNYTDNFEDFKNDILNCITKINHLNAVFKKLYMERKKLLRSFPDSDIAIFIKENSVDPSEEIYRLTDNTQIERKQILCWISKHGWNDEYSYVYPLLASYLKKYRFECGDLSDEITQYFEQYKLQKVTNKLQDEFIARIECAEKSYKYTRLQTRDNALKKVANIESAYLYWIDAMGVEYLSLITELAKKKGLSIHIEVARADLPTITRINKGFYDNWNGVNKYKEEDLDNIKHNDKGGFFFTECEEPIHLESEISVIEKAINNAATKLAMHECKSFIITSDHGASRLAVIRKKKKYDTDTKGEHSGRCCKKTDECTVENVVEENGYYVLTDYGRFKGGRDANVEVHGGATLEEVLVPVITLTLKHQSPVDIRVLDETNIFADRKLGTTLKLYISEVENQNNIYIVVENNKYKSIASDASHYSVIIGDIKRSRKKCQADIYDGDNLLGSVFFEIKSKSGGVDSSFDSEFNDF